MNYSNLEQYIHRAAAYASGNLRQGCTSSAEVRPMGQIINNALHLLTFRQNLEILIISVILYVNYRHGSIWTDREGTMPPILK